MSYKWWRYRVILENPKGFINVYSICLWIFPPFNQLWLDSPLFGIDARQMMQHMAASFIAHVWCTKTTSTFKCHLLSCKMTQRAGWHWDSGHCQWMVAVLQLGSWSARESVEGYPLYFPCSIRLCMNFFHLLAYWGKSSLNADVFHAAAEWVAGWRSPLMFHWLPGEDWN